MKSLFGSIQLVSDTSGSFFSSESLSSSSSASSPILSSSKRVYKGDPMWLNVDTSHPKFLREMLEMRVAQLETFCADITKMMNRPPMSLTAEDVSLLLATSNKKCYAKNKVEVVPGKPPGAAKKKIAGMASQRRDRVQIARGLVNGIVDDAIIHQKTWPEIASRVEKLVLQMKNNKIDFNEYVRGVALGELFNYANVDAIPAVKAARQVEKYDPGRAMSAGDYCSWIYAKSPESKTINTIVESGLARGIMKYQEEERKLAVEHKKKRELDSSLPIEPPLPEKIPPMLKKFGRPLVLDLGAYWLNHTENSIRPALEACNPKKARELFAWARATLECQKKPLTKEKKKKPIVTQAESEFIENAWMLGGKSHTNPKANEMMPSLDDPDSDDEFESHLSDSVDY